MVDSATRGVNLHSLHLLWTVPLAFAVGYLPAAIVRFQRCGIHECLGEVVGFASPIAPQALAVAAFAAVALLAALALPPWIRPAGVRVGIASCVAVLVFVAYLWNILFT